MNHSLVKNYALLLLVMVIWGSNVIIFKVLVQYVPVASMMAIRNLIAAIVLMLFVTRGMEFFRLTRKEWFYTIFAALTGIAAHHLLLAKGLLTSTASSSAVILALSPTATAVFSYLILKVMLSKIQMLGVLVSFMSVFLLITNTSAQIGGAGIGLIYVLLSMLLQSLSYIYIRKATYTMEPKQLTAIMLFIGSIGLFIYSLLTEPNGMKELFLNTSTNIWLLLIFSAVASSAIGQMLYNSSIQKIGANKTAIFSNLIPFFSLIFSVIFLREIITLYQITLFVFVIIGVLLCVGFNEPKVENRISN